MGTPPRFINLSKTARLQPARVELTSPWCTGDQVEAVMLSGEEDTASSPNH